MQDPEQHPPADSLAEAIQAADDAICRLNGVPDPLAHQDWDHDDVADAAVRAAAPILRAEGRREADGAILWNTTCIGCAKQLDTLYAERVAGAEDVLGDVVGLLGPSFPAAAAVVRQWAARQALAVREPSGDGLDVLAEPAVRAVEAPTPPSGATGRPNGSADLTAPSGAANQPGPQPSPTMSTTRCEESS